MPVVKTKKRGAVEFIPLALSLVIAIIILVQVGVPILNATLYHNVSAGGNASMTDWTAGFTGATGSILSSVAPLFVVASIAVIAVGLMTMFGKG